MSDVKTALMADIKEAMKARDQEKLTTLRGLSAAIKQVEIDTREDVSQEAAIQIIQKEVKKRRDAIKFAEDAGRPELVAQNEVEIKLLQNYLGAQLDEAKLREIIGGLVSGGAGNIGQVMGALNKDYKGQFEGSVASGIAKELLAG